MSIYAPEKNWFHAPEGAERVWIGLALTWCLVMFVMMTMWHFKGKQNSTGEAYRVDQTAFAARVDSFVKSNAVLDEKGNPVFAEVRDDKGVLITDTRFPVVEPSPGGDAYLYARLWYWTPVLRLKAGQTYRIHISGETYQHGFSLQPMNMNFQILPGYDHVLTVTPTKGDYQIICNEFCGLGHHKMTGKIEVVE